MAAWAAEPDEKNSGQARLSLHVPGFSTVSTLRARDTRRQPRLFRFRQKRGFRRVSHCGRSAK
jgi:hypothetical protein